MNNMNTSDFLTEVNTTNGARGPANSHLPPGLQIIITVFYVVGIMGNAMALNIISKSETKKYRKQVGSYICKMK